MSWARAGGRGSPPLSLWRGRGRSEACPILGLRRTAMAMAVCRAGRVEGSDHPPPPPGIPSQLLRCCGWHDMDAMQKPSALSGLPLDALGLVLLAGWPDSPLAPAAPPICARVSGSLWGDADRSRGPRAYLRDLGEQTWTARRPIGTCSSRTHRVLTAGFLYRVQRQRTTRVVWAR